VSGTITPRIALIIVVIVVAGLVLSFTPLRVIGCILFAVAAVLYVAASVASFLQLRKKSR
jgi:hypothetical protein